MPLLVAGSVNPYLHYAPRGTFRAHLVSLFLPPPSLTLVPRLCYVVPGLIVRSRFYIWVRFVYLLPLFLLPVSITFGLCRPHAYRGLTFIFVATRCRRAGRGCPHCLLPHIYGCLPPRRRSPRPFLHPTPFFSDIGCPDATPTPTSRIPIPCLPVHTVRLGSPLTVGSPPYPRPATHFSWFLDAAHS